jgi:hypothetical protein
VLGDEPPTPNGLLPTRGPGRADGGRGASGAGASAASAAGTTAAAGAIGSGIGGANSGAGATAGAGGTSTTGATGSAATALAAAFFAGAFFVGAAPGAGAGNAPRRRRSTGASTVEDGPLTYSPNSLNLARTSLLVTPSSLASAETRALPAT